MGFYLLLELEGRRRGFRKREARCPFPWVQALVLTLRERMPGGCQVGRTRSSSAEALGTLREGKGVAGRAGPGPEGTVEPSGKDFSLHLIHSFILGPSVTALLPSQVPSLVPSSADSRCPPGWTFGWGS